jgi:hypothetical protein
VRPALLVIAKAPAPGRVKTRLSPPCSPEQAAALATAALADTLAAVAALPGRRVLVLDGAPGDWIPPGFEVVAQRGDGLAERLAAAFADAGGPAVLVGMDTPQITPALLDRAVDGLGSAGAVFGPAEDGGFWLIGLQQADPRVFAGIPMSVESTGACQRARLGELGLDVAEVPVLRDVDTIEDARAVAAAAPYGGFAAALAHVEAALEVAA